MPARVRRRDELAEVLERAVVRVDALVVGDVVAVVLERRREERQEPQAGDAEVLEVVELLDEPAQIADAVVVRVVERLDVRLVDDRVLVPERVLRAPPLGRRHPGRPPRLARCTAARAPPAPPACAAAAGRTPGPSARTRAFPGAAPRPHLHARGGAGAAAGDRVGLAVAASLALSGCAAVALRLREPRRLHRVRRSDPPDLADAQRRVDRAPRPRAAVLGALEPRRVAHPVPRHRGLPLLPRRPRTRAARTTSRRPSRCASRRTRTAASRRPSCCTSSATTSSATRCTRTRAGTGSTPQFAAMVWDSPGRARRSA